uniref:Piezo TM1-24 domain-containing protein n=1 Tax=Anguilla anguilla TaxID=7936 RepID=A0A0E9R6X0_ANGAN
MLRQEALEEVKVQPSVESEASPLMTLVGALVKGTLVKYWILFCCAMFFVVSFSGKVMVYKILYIMLFLLCLVLYQVGRLLHHTCFNPFHILISSLSLL